MDLFSHARTHKGVRGSAPVGRRPAGSGRSARRALARGRTRARARVLFRAGGRASRGRRPGSDSRWGTRWSASTAARMTRTSTAGRGRCRPFGQESSSRLARQLGSGEGRRAWAAPERRLAQVALAAYPAPSFRPGSGRLGSGRPAGAGEPGRRGGAAQAGVACRCAPAGKCAPTGWFAVSE